QCAETHVCPPETGVFRLRAADRYGQLSKRTLDDVGGGLPDDRRLDCAYAPRSAGQGLCSESGDFRRCDRRDQPDLSRCPLADRRARGLGRRLRLGALLLAGRSALAEARRCRESLRRWAATAARRLRQPLFHKQAQRVCEVAAERRALVEAALAIKCDGFRLSDPGLEAQDRQSLLPGRSLDCIQYFVADALTPRFRIDPHPLHLAGAILADQEGPATKRLFSL